MIRKKSFDVLKDKVSELRSPWNMAGILSVVILTFLDITAVGISGVNMSLLNSRQLPHGGGIL